MWRRIRPPRREAKARQRSDLRCDLRQVMRGILFPNSNAHHAAVAALVREKTHGERAWLCWVFSRRASIASDGVGRIRDGGFDVVAGQMRVCVQQVGFGCALG